jgi:hypothetical protein
MQQERLSYLLKQYKGGLLTEREREELKELCSPAHESDLLDWIQHKMETDAFPLANISEKELQALAVKIVSVDKPEKKGEEAKLSVVHRMHRTHYAPIIRWAAAAVILLMVGIGIYYYAVKRPKALSVAEASKKVLGGNDVLPGGNNAVLTLANGKKIILNNLHDGTVANQGKSKVVKVSSGMIAYRAEGATHKAPSSVTFNTLSTPKGGQYQIVLPDGTKVWLNAVSSITFPTAFTGKDREVEITGEAYFEVAENAVKPFIVKALPTLGGGREGVEVQVLGTHFDVNAYQDESSLKVTLIEGSVKVAQVATHHTQLIAPGEQAQVNANGNIILNTHVDTSEAVAWKNGKFRFDNTSLPELMRQLSRWYDVKVIYTGNVKEDAGKYAFVGEIERDSKLSLVLKLLELGGVHFKIEDKELIVMP